MKVLVFIARGLHLGYLGPYGNDWIETPAFDRLAAEGVVFDQHYADRPDPDGARAAWRTGRYVFPAPEGDVPRAETTGDLLAALRGAGVVCSLVRDGSRAAPESFADGWDRRRVSAPSGGEATALERALDAWQAALDELSGTDNGLLWLELATLLPPWDLPEGYAVRYLVELPDEEEEEEEDEDEVPIELLTDPTMGPLDPDDDDTFIRLQRAYAAAAGYLDAGLELIFKELEDRQILDDVLLLVTTDFGLPLGEHGVVGLDGAGPFDELIHLPLMMRLPGAAEAGRRVGALTQSVDLMPTLLDAFGVAAPPEVHGRSVLPLARGAIAPLREYACAGARVGAAVAWTLRTPEWALLLTRTGAPNDAPPTAKLFAKPEDRWEMNDVIQHHGEQAERLEQTLRDFVAATRRPGPLAPPPLHDENAQAESPL